ncbi:MAG: DNA gyrase C-terminal beta-propeller domain-containing protein, partial [Halobacteriaceae archaeon]
SKVFCANTHDYLLCFTNHGEVYQLKTYEIPEMSRTARGKSAVNLLDLDRDEEITAVVNTDDFGEEEFLTMVTRNGYVKRTPASAFESVLSTGIIAAKLEEGDALVDVAVTDGTRDLLVESSDGRAIRFAEEEARSMGRTARGVNSIELEEGQGVVGLVAADPEDDADLLTVTRNGYGKRTPLSAYRRQSRYGKGLVDVKTGDRNGPVAAVERVEADDELVVVSADGQIMRIAVDDVSSVGRNTQGVVVMDVAAGDAVASVDVVPRATAANGDGDGAAASGPDEPAADGDAA